MINVLLQNIDQGAKTTKIDASVVQALYEHEQLGFREVAIRLGVSPWQVYRFMKQHNIPRRRGSEQNYATYKTKPQFVLKTPLTAQEEQLKIAGAMLYWAEGAKTGKTVDLANSDPELIRLFVTFLRTVCGVADSRLRALVYTHSDQDVEQQQAFWSTITGIPRGQFIKPSVQACRPQTKHRIMTHGLVHV